MFDLVSLILTTKKEICCIPHLKKIGAAGDTGVIILLIVKNKILGKLAPTVRHKIRVVGSSGILKREGWKF